MVVPLPSSRWWPPRGRAADVLVAAAIAALGVVEALVVEPAPGPRAVLVLAMVVTGSALAWRRERPLAAVVGVFGPELALVAVGASLEGFNGASAAFILAIYSAAEYEGGRRAALALAFTSGSVAISVYRDSNRVEDYVFAVLVVALSWLAGRAVRARVQQVAALTEAAVRLEVQQQERAQRAVAEERERIARELHDVVAHTVTAIVVQAGAAEGVVRSRPEAAESAMRAIQETGRSTQAEMVRLLGFLRDDHAEIGLAPQPTLAELSGLLGDAERAGSRVSLVRVGDLDALPPGVSLAGYRILQEALTNVRRHAGPAAIAVAVELVGDVLAISVRNGPPCAGHPASPGTGQGLVGMRERVACFGGSLDVGPEPDGGFRIVARLRVDAPAAVVAP